MSGTAETRFEIRVTAELWESLTAHLRAQGERNERFAYATGGWYHTADGRTVLCLTRWLKPERQHLQVQGPAQVAPTRRIAKRVTDLVAASGRCLVELHSHPFAEEAWFSSADRQCYSYLLPLWQQKLGPAPCGAMVLARQGAVALVWDERAGRCVEARVRVLGEQSWLEQRPAGVELLDGGPPETGSRVPALGAVANLYFRLRVGIVGAGGLGFLLAQALAQMGIGKLVVCDLDHVEEGNLTRLPGARAADAGRPKVEVLRRLVRRLGGPTRISCFNCAPSGSSRAQAALAGTDVLFGSIDNLPARWWIDAFAASHLIPYIDLASQLYPDTPRIAGRVATAMPGAGPCLTCRGRFAAAGAARIELALQSWADPEFEQESRGHGYGLQQLLPGTGPQVLPLNQGIVAEGLWRLLDIAAGLRPNRPHDAVYEGLVPSWTAISAARWPGCPNCCARAGRLGAGVLCDLLYRPLRLPAPRMAAAV